MTCVLRLGGKEQARWPRQVSAFRVMLCLVGLVIRITSTFACLWQTLKPPE